ncbi:uncharacterized protein LOC135943618 [Cloeon dipterum]|uniref:uncharacterized protein LOC135943618 n=1 Tax=Cloeon dipterum TaxID=197152 RepID=UPI00322014F4
MKAIFNVRATANGKPALDDVRVIEPRPSRTKQPPTTGVMRAAQPGGVAATCTLGTGTLDTSDSSTRQTMPAAIKTESGYNDCMLALDYAAQSKVDVVASAQARKATGHAQKLLKSRFYAQSHFILITKLVLTGTASSWGGFGASALDGQTAQLTLDGQYSCEARSV